MSEKCIDWQPMKTPGSTSIPSNMPAVKVQETAAMSIAQSDVGVILLGHPLQGRLWHCIINTQLNIPDQQTAQPSAL